jgi:hypothetical protein
MKKVYSRKGFWIGVGVVLVGLGISLFHGCSQMDSQSGEGQGWHIVVKRSIGPQREQWAGMVYESLKLVRGLDTQKVRKYQLADSSVVTYGRYSSLDDPNAQKDLKFIKSLASPEQGIRPFIDAHLEPISDPDPPIESDWIITNTKGYWTLQIGLFHGEKRKQAAVDVVAQLRNDGVPAYVFHGPVKSMVMIGAYPESAVKTPKTQEISQNLKPVDPDLRTWKTKYPYLIVNSGYARFKDSRGGQRLESQIIKIPRPGMSLW